MADQLQAPVSAGCLSSTRTAAARWRGAVAWVLLFLFANAALAADPATAFDQANKLFEQGKYPEAIAAYQDLVRQNQVSAPLYFNLANACFKNGQTGQAIVYYRLAQQLDPRDPDIRANLRFARESAGGRAAANRPWQRWLNVLTLNELSLAAAAALWLWFLLLIAGQIRRDWHSALRPYRIALGLITAIALSWLGFVLQQRFGISAAVVIAREAVVRYGPFDEAQGFYTLRDGAELTILDRKDSWLQVRDPARGVGWVRSNDVVVLPHG